MDKKIAKTIHYILITASGLCEFLFFLVYGIGSALDPQKSFMTVAWMILNSGLAVFFIDIIFQFVNLMIIMIMEIWEENKND